MPANHTGLNASSPSAEGLVRITAQKIGSLVEMGS